MKNFINLLLVGFICLAVISACSDSKTVQGPPTLDKATNEQVAAEVKKRVGEAISQRQQDVESKMEKAKAETQNTSDQAKGWFWQKEKAAETAIEEKASRAKGWFSN